MIGGWHLAADNIKYHQNRAERAFLTPLSCTTYNCQACYAPVGVPAVLDDTCLTLTHTAHMAAHEARTPVFEHPNKEGDE